ncbi:MAG: hypothetical protein ACRBBS_13210 [Thalassovita sp.]
MSGSFNSSLLNIFFNFIPDFQVGLDNWPCFQRPTAKGYLLVFGKRKVRVDQTRLLKVGRAMLDPEMVVQYLGGTNR